jgi:hypothetical protein
LVVASRNPWIPGGDLLGSEHSRRTLPTVPVNRVERSPDVHVKSTEDERDAHGEGRRWRRPEGAFAVEVRDRRSKDIHEG